MVAGLGDSVGNVASKFCVLVSYWYIIILGLVVWSKLHYVWFVLIPSRWP